MIADHTGSEMAVMSGEANITSIDGLHESVRKTKVEIQILDDLRITSRQMTKIVLYLMMKYDITYLKI